MINVLIFGAPGSGKGTQSARIAQTFGLEHVSTGDILRKEIADQTSLGILAQDYIKEGHLVPDEDVVAMLEHHLEGKLGKVKGFIFDGFPRTIPQADALKRMLARHDCEVSIVLDLNVPEDELIRRLLERGKISGRSDDNLEAIKSRLVVYNSQTLPLKEYFRKEGTLTPINGLGDMDDIFASISEAIDSVL